MGDFDKFGAVIKSVGCTLTLKSIPNFFCDISINLTNADKHYWNRFDNPINRLSGVVGVKCSKNQVTSFGGGHSQTDGFQVAHLTH